MKSRLFFVLLGSSILLLSSCSKKNTPTKFVDVDAISITSSAATLNVGETTTYELEVTPSDGTITDLYWESDNERVATVDSKTGLITAVGYGSTYIHAKIASLDTKLRISVKEPKRTYKLTWSDEFNGTSVDKSKWYFTKGMNVNQEKQYYTEQNATVQGGYLLITGKKEDMGNAHYTSARLHSTYAQAYGKMEARICWGEGKGTWPAFWMMPQSPIGSWPLCGEIDIVEHVGSSPKLVSNAVHTKLKNGTGYPGGNWGVRTYQDNIETEFHTYAIEWVEKYYNGNDAIIFYFDGKQTAMTQQTNWKESTNADWPFNYEFYAILNLAIGGTWGGEIDDNIFPTVMKVDWVRFYQLEK